MNMVDLFRAMLPPVSYDLNGKYISAELTAEADVMEVVKASAARVSDTNHPVAGIDDAVRLGARVRCYSS